MASPSNSTSPAAVTTGGQHPSSTDELTKPFQDIKVDQEDHELIDSLKALSKKSPKLVKSSEYQAPADPSIFVRSWKMNEFKYYDVPSPFPTLARGLFTQEIKNVSGRTKHRIVARGYDKFFNIGEVPWTTWAALESHTAPPYTLTLKSNGCIIFIAALTPTKLLITSKHSVGPTPGSSGAESHAQVGERWLRKHLAAANKTEEQLAQTLWDKNWTAVAELCDDSFEEHVLPYSADKTGLHLHGLNACTKAFQTQPQPVVDAFAAEWGFIPTASTVLPTIPAVQAFTEQIAHAGEWHGEAVEGFVVRTRVSASASAPDRHTPYAAGSSFFFKVKFDEPYLMYRDWREVTKSLLSKGPSAGNVPRGKLRRAETKLYVDWVCAEIRRDRAQFDGFTKGKGIIATRERFLKWMESGAGKGSLAHDGEEVAGEASAAAEEEAVDLTKGKVIIVPVAIPGVGKTSVAVGLQHLFGFAHVQSDDVTAKKPAPIFIKNVAQALRKHDVVIADKNNHLAQHRAQLRAAASALTPPARLLALHWPLRDLPRATAHRLCAARIAARGDRHQTLHAGEHERVLWQFLDAAEELRDAEVDAVVGMDVEEPLEDALARAAGAVAGLLGRERPGGEAMGLALAAARAYEPRLKGKGKGGKGGRRNANANGKAKEEEEEEGEAAPAQAKKKQDKKQDKKEKNGKTKPPRYYGILAEVDLPSVVGPALSGLPSEARALWDGLVREKRVQARPHVTLVHAKQLQARAQDAEENTQEKEKEGAGAGAGALWERCRAVDALALGRAPPLRFRLGHVVWNERIMAVTVVDVDVDVAPDNDGGEGGERGEGGGGDEVRALVAALGGAVRERLHVTVGTRDKGVPPVEAGDMVLEWKRRGQGEEKAGVWAVPLADVWAKGQVKGLFQ